MKKRIGAMLLLVLLCAVTGCGKEKSKITLGEYKGLTYTPISTEVTDSEIEAALKQVITEKTTYTKLAERDGTEVKDGDLLLIDYSGKVKETGEAFSGGTAKDTRLKIGSDKFIDGFEDALIGKKVGETCDITVTLPEIYAANAELAGKEAIFTVTIKEVQQEEAPEMSDELIAAYTEGVHKTVDSYKEYCREYLKQDKEADAREKINQELLQKIIDNTTFETIREEDIKEYYDSVIQYYTTIADYMSVSLETYVSYYYDQSLEEFYKSVQEIAQNTVKEQLVLDAIIEKEGITLSEEKYQEMVKDYMEQYEYTDQQKFEEEYTVKSLRKSMLYELAINFIYDNAKPE